jgi:hypothetical protein
MNYGGSAEDSGSINSPIRLRAKMLPLFLGKNEY